MGHSHDHQHHHHHGSGNKDALKWAFIIITLFMVVEVIGGIMTNSLALLSDAGHMLSDSAALGLSFLAMTYGKRASSHSKTFGYKRFEILAAFINGIALIAIAIYIFWEAYHRILQPVSIVSSGMLIVSVIGFIVNIIAAFILMRGDKDENINVRSAFLHVLGDLLGSVGAIIAALLIMFFGWGWADPAASVIVAVLVLISGWRVTKESIHILMEGTPANINIDKVKQTLLSIQEVKEVNDLHVWSITSDFPAFSCHLVTDTGIDQQALLIQANSLLHDEYHIEHTTIQIDAGGHPCKRRDHCN